MNRRALRAALIPALAALVAGGLGALPAQADTGPTAAYVVQVAPGHQGTVAGAVERAGGDATASYGSAVDVVTARLTARQAAAIAARGDVRLVEPDRTFTLTDTQSPATWGLDRLDQAALPLNNRYTYDSAAGRGVRVYVVDTGVSPKPTQFGTRLVAGYTAIVDGNGTTDCHGHGTHVAGTIASTTYGVAKLATIVPVRVMSCAGSGSTSSIIAGLSWIAEHHPAGTPGVVNLSIGGPADAATNAAVETLVSDGLTVVVAAGNAATDACTTSPASAPDAITVGAVDASDAKASFSDDGRCVDVWAPGVGITSLTPSGGTAVMSGTSMASPHVAGIAALYLAEAPKATPAQVTAAVLAAAHPVVTGTWTAGGRLASSAVVPAPAAPTVTATTTTTTATLAITPGSNGSAPTSTTVTARVPGGTTTPRTQTTTTTAATLTGLTPGTTYQLSVTGSNAIGTGATTTLSVTTLPTPAAPTGLTVSAVGGDTLTLGWAVPSTGTPTSYQVQRSTDGVTWVPAGVTGTPGLVLTGLAPATTVRLRVDATTTGTQGAWSAVTSATTLPAPSAPSVRVTATSRSALAVSWSVPTTSAALITGYVVQRSTDRTTWTNVTTTSAGTTSATITGLATGSSTWVRVAPRWSGGAGAWSVSVPATTLRS